MHQATSGESWEATHNPAVRQGRGRKTNVRERDGWMKTTTVELFQVICSPFLIRIRIQEEMFFLLSWLNNRISIEDPSTSGYHSPVLSSEKLKTIQEQQSCTRNSIESPSSPHFLLLNNKVSQKNFLRLLQFNWFPVPLACSHPRK